MTGRTILITGARRGIGAALAEGLAEPGTTLVLHHLAAEQETAEVARRCAEAGATVRIAEADLADPAATSALADRAGAVDILVNNAARASNVAIGELSPAEWQATFAVNVTAPMLLAQALAGGMRARGWGRVINITSATVRLAGPSGPAYVASKAALVGLTRSLARAWGPDGVTVNAISPGAIRTESEVELAGGRDQADLDDDVIARQAMRRRLVPEDLVAAARFLAGDGAAGVTGQVIEVGAGLVYR
ncbi:3-oxoacyl-ACP reductase [Sphaerisporangium krabiense]|uniref:NAD(P)-dependent dehydrogenase (Short-subunit alcohol dehydrogenase family) n=1 Tax=Sphaerisporangium krabiense TaxID=763782 RepID=A0A7W9DSN8_9ACTN|nr:SDR family oxidoreductase [Sphaerisporangium krabiense]MBB5629768.1 NAD(P)-dependent dehydrogenase (short-subunit alcohol dehydrogenase family) [Sphaerisporangium krabiense]GII63867.1 3-oxoacyl-ACP reductase [Sphaerisporangium krabiense]